jgi:hypothetical protein
VGRTGFHIIRVAIFCFLVLGTNFAVKKKRALILTNGVLSLSLYRIMCQRFHYFFKINTKQVGKTRYPSSRV